MRIKLLAVVLLGLSLHISARGTAQNVLYSGTNVSLKTVLRAVEKQTGYVFFYDEALIENRRVSIKAENVSVENFMEKLMAGSNLRYSIQNKTVVIRKPSEIVPEKIQEPVSEEKQERLPIKGRVVAENGDAMASASVVVKGAATGTTTDENGYFSLENVDANAVLIITGVNIARTEIPVNGRTNFTITVKLSIIEEEVVIAYGTSRKKDLTGSVSTISKEAISDLPPTINLEQALQGQAAGVMVIQESGQPGAATRVRIRGASSLMGSNQPLYVVDGVPVEPQQNIPSDGSAFNNELLQEGLSSPLNNLNPADIESISVLKDASATAIYGSRATNGVILITTKRGSYAGKTEYAFNSSISIQKPLTQNMLNAAQFREIMTEAANNSTSTALVVQRIKDGSYFGSVDTDWEKEVSPSNAITRNANFSISGGNKSLRYFTSFGMNDQNGTFENSRFERYNLLTNLDAVLSPKVKVGTSINLSSSNQLSPDGALLTRIYSFRPDQPVYNADGSYYYSTEYNLENPVALSQAKNFNNTLLLIGSGYLEANITKDLKLRSVLSVNLNNGDYNAYYPSYTFLGGWGRIAGMGDGYAKGSHNKSLSHLWENTLSYNRRFGERHNIEAIAGASWQGDQNDFIAASGEGFPQDDILSNLSSASHTFTIASQKTQSGLVSYFGRINYGLDDKYILTLSARNDGSSKFAVENKWAFFPTAAFAWRMIDEKFFADATWITDLKLRASIGLTGQQSFSAYQWRTLFDAAQYGGMPAVTVNQLGNNRLKWETTRQTDFGLDFGLLNKRIQGAVDVYERYTRDLLYTMIMPGNTGFSTTPANLGNTVNRGIEFSVDGRIVDGKDFKWNLTLNLSHNQNKLVSLNDDFFDPAKGTITPPSTGAVMKIGQPLGLMWGRIADGIIQTQEQLDALNAGAPGGVYQTVGTRPGDILFRDISGPDGVPDGRITADDQTIIGKAMPTIAGGFTNTFMYKNFRLATLFTYTLGNDVRWGTQSTSMNIGTTFNGENKMDLIMNRWTPDNPTNQPRVVYGDPNLNSTISSFYVHDASYLRLKNVILSYSIPASFLSKTHFVKTGSLNFSATNLLTFTKYPGPNPETSNLFNNDLSAGLDNSRYPIAKVYTATIRLTF